MSESMEPERARLTLDLIEARKRIRELEAELEAWVLLVFPNAEREESES